MIERIENLIKSKRDSRQYRGLRLENNLKCLLIRDESVEISSASLNVNIGYFSDSSTPGLAHLCEHMLFMGSSKYPDSNTFKKFIEDNAGTTNAYTSGKNTNFYLQLPKQFFSKALEIFVQFFISPRFCAQQIEQEIQIIEHEFRCQLSSDEFRLDQLDKSTCLENHLFNRFGSGNLTSLKSSPNLREELIHFFNTYYSANLMQLCLLSNESLDQLEHYALRLFEQIPNKNAIPLQLDTNPYNKNAEVYYVLPVQEKRELILTFYIPDHDSNYCTSGYVTYLISNESENSLIGELKKKNLCNCLSACTSHQIKGLKFFNIYMDMTPEGEARINEILKLVFQYLKLIKLNKPSFEVFSEMNKLKQIKFEFKHKEKSIDYVTHLSQSLSECESIENCLIYKQYYTEFDAALVEDVLDYLKPNKMKLFIVSKSNLDRVTQTEKWYGTAYKKEKLLSYLIDDLETCDLNPFLSLPTKNLFLPSDLSLANHESLSKHPRLVHMSNVSQVWFKEDIYFKLPKIYLKFELNNPLVLQSLINYNLVNLFVMVLCDSLVEYSYPAGLAGLLYMISSNDFGLQVCFSGFSDKMIYLVEYVFNAMLNVEISLDRFNSLKDTVSLR